MPAPHKSMWSGELCRAGPFGEQRVCHARACNLLGSLTIKQMTGTCNREHLTYTTVCCIFGVAGDIRRELLLVTYVATSARDNWYKMVFPTSENDGILNIKNIPSPYPVG